MIKEKKQYLLVQMIHRNATRILSRKDTF